MDEDQQVSSGCMFGLIDTSQDPALGYMELERDAATLLPLISVLLQ